MRAVSLLKNTTASRRSGCLFARHESAASRRGNYEAQIAATCCAAQGWKPRADAAGHPRRGRTELLPVCFAEAGSQQ